MKKNGWITTGIEPDEAARQMARDNYDLEVFPEEGLPQLENDSFDVITMWHVLEHVSDLNGRMKDLHRLLKPGGILLLAVPNSGSFDASHYKEYWAAYDVPRHLYHFSADSMNHLLTRHDFKLQQILPMKFDAFYVSILSEKYKNKKSDWIFGFWFGLCSNWNARRAKNYSSLIFVAKKN
jgi:2-polyprenyl-3-methyl-5-hydroxy-6-metoxy-1,4-benzoquinol methylase